MNPKLPPFPGHANTIFAEFEHDVLKKQLTDWADKNGCGIQWGDGEDDLLAYGSFVQIIDRQVVPESTYDWYVRWSRGEDIPIEVEGPFLETEDGQSIHWRDLPKELQPDPNAEPKFVWIEWTIRSASSSTTAET